MRAVIVCLLGSLLPLPLMASDAPVVEQLRKDIVGKSFVLRMPVAGSTCIVSGNMGFPETGLVDTELSATSGPLYYLRASRLNVHHCMNSRGRVDNVLSGAYLAPGMIGLMHDAGTNVAVQQIEAKGDRIEVLLQADGGFHGDEGYGKIKLMLGKEYPSKTLQQIEEVLARAFVMPRLDAIEQDESNLAQIKEQIAVLEANLTTEAGADARIDKANHLIELYQEQSRAQGILNQVAFAQEAYPSSTPRITELNALITESRKQAGKQRLQEALAQYSELSARMTTACGQIGGSAPVTEAGLESRVAALTQTRQLLTEFDEARQRMAALGQAVGDNGYVKCLATLDQANRDVEASRESLRTAQIQAEQMEKIRELSKKLADVNGGYSTLKKQKQLLDSQLVGALGGANESELFAAYRNQLMLMIENRQRAMALGDKSAKGEIQSLEEQLRKLG